mmetsp:Transcript_50211/g.142385  ORF Transcript_50211/g.142385 Transcript_50211/m.142385 type:complete len:192 (+) Transcript_50211:1-576(+)
MKTVGDRGAPEVAATAAASSAVPVRCRNCPLRWAGGCRSDGPVQDLREHLLNDHKFATRNKLPVKKHFCTSSGFEGAREWGHLVTLRGHTLAYVIGYQPSVSKTHGFVSIFAMQHSDAQALGPISVSIAPVVPKDSAGVRAAQFSWSEVPHANADVEQVAGLFPIKLFSSRLAEGKPHERAVEITIQTEVS